MKHKKVAIGLGVVGTIAVSLLLFTHVFGKPKVTIRCSRDQAGSLVVDLDHNWRVHHFWRVYFRMEGDDEDMWVLRETRVPIRHIVYGEIPHGSIQKYPADNMPPKPLPKKGILHVSVDYAWDSYIPPAPTGSDHRIEVLLTEDGRVTLLEEFGYEVCY